MLNVKNTHAYDAKTAEAVSVFPRLRDLGNEAQRPGPVTVLARRGAR